MCFRYLTQTLARQALIYYKKINQLVQYTKKIKLDFKRRSHYSIIFSCYEYQILKILLQSQIPFQNFLKVSILIFEIQMLERNQQLFTSLINQYLSTNLRADSFLQQLPIYFNFISNPKSLLINSIQQNQYNPITALKYLILIHRILCDGTDRKQVLYDILSQMETKDHTDFDKMLTIKLIKPYKLFLQKRLMLEQKGNANPAHFFPLINLLWSAMAFVDILYTFGRYYVYSYPFFTDFNITLGKDVEIIYRKMSKSLSKDIKQMAFPEIQKLHEKMYIVYYNCYFYKHLKPFIPKWINTDNTAPSSAQSIKLKGYGQNSSLSHSTLGFNMMGKSMIVGKNRVSKNEEDSRLQVIKSMQRIVSLFN